MNNLFFSIIIPHFDPDEKMKNLLKKCVDSVKKNSVGQNVELLIIKSLKSYSENVNEGIKKAKGNFFIILNNDIEIRDRQWLEKMYTKSGISAWRMEKSYLSKMIKLVPDASCWGMSRETFKKIGMIDERFKKGYGFEDTDYWMRAKKINIKFYNAKVDLIHHKNTTFNTYFSESFIFQYNYNENLFLKKWKLI